MAVDAIAVIVRGLDFIAIFQATGMAIFIWAFAESVSETTGKWLRASSVVYGLAALLLSAVHFALEPARMGGAFAAMGDSDLQAIALASPQARALVWKVAGLALVIAGTAWATRIGQTLTLFGTALVLIGFTRMGHTSAHEARPLLGTLLSLHLAVAAFWFGALLPLIRISRAESPAICSAIVERFSRTAIWIVPALGVAGLTMAVLLLESPRNLATPYGLILLAKLATFALLMGLAALNRWRHGPALAGGDPGATMKFARTVRIEYVLIATVLMATATLTTSFSPDW